MWGFIGAYTLAPRGMTVSRRNHVLSEPSLSSVLVSPSVSVPEARVSPNALRRRAPTWWAERPQTHGPEAVQWLAATINKCNINLRLILAVLPSFSAS